MLDAPREVRVAPMGAGFKVSSVVPASGVFYLKRHKPDRKPFKPIKKTVKGKCFIDLDARGTIVGINILA